MTDVLPPDRISLLTEQMATQTNGSRVSMRTATILKAHISVLTSALGGPDHTSPLHPPPYKLGDDAWACLKDLKRWLITVDQDKKKYDVANACAETGLVLNDLCTILATWELESDAARGAPRMIMNRPPSLMNKIALLCLELFVQLTWPVDIIKGESSRNQAKHSVNIQKHQLLYKQKALHYAGGKVLRAAIRLAIPAISKDKTQRDAKDNAILSLVVYFFRNLVEIRPLPLTKLQGLSARASIQNSVDLHVNGEIGLDATVRAFANNQVLPFLMTMTSLLGDEFNIKDLEWLCFETITGLVKYVTPETLYPRVAPSVPRPSHELASAAGLGLSDLLQREKHLQQQMKLNSSTRHANFGTLLSYQTTAQRYTVSGQQGLHNDREVLAKLDASKKSFKAVRDISAAAAECDKYVVSSAALDAGNTAVLRAFVDDIFSDTFNNLVHLVTGSLTAGFESVLMRDKAMFCQFFSWFLRAHRAKIEQRAQSDGPSDSDADAFDMIQSALTNECFIILKKLLREHEALRTWSMVHVSLACLSEYLLTVHLMTVSSPYAAHALALNIYDDPFILDLIVRLTKQASSGIRGVSHLYMGTAVECSYWFLRVLETCARQDMKLTVRARRKKPEDGDNSDDEGPTKSLLDFQKYESAFISVDMILTHVAFLARFADLSCHQTRCVLKYFHRVFVKNNQHALMFRIDLMRLLQEMMTKVEGEVLQELRNFAKFYTKTLVKVLEARPTLFVELLFSKKTRNVCYYLDTGEKMAERAKKARYESDDEVFAAEELEYVKDHGYEEKVAIVVAAMIDDEDDGIVRFVSAQLAEIIRRRKAWEDRQDAEEMAALARDEGMGAPEASERKQSPPNEAITTPDPSLRNSLLLHGYLRLLLKTIGFELARAQGEQTLVLADVETAHLELSREYVEKYLVTPVDLGGKEAAQCIRTADEGDFFHKRSRSDGEEIAFEVRRKRVRGVPEEEVDDLEAMENRLGMPRGLARKKSKKPARVRADRTKKRSKASVETHRSFKSSAFVHDSDDEDDTEESRAFFALEERLRQVVVTSADTGGLTGAALAEFILRWDTLTRMSHQEPEPHVQKAVAKAKSSLFVESDEEEEGPERVPDVVRARRHAFSSDEEVEESEWESDAEMDAAIDAAIAAVDAAPVTTAVRQFESDPESESEEGENDTENEIEVAAEEVAAGEVAAGEVASESDVESSQDNFRDAYSEAEVNAETGDQETTPAMRSRRKQVIYESDDE
ncbi:hypothetical protein BABINDRAFT_175653 [Babjeviella inositovora NRRL Y-12698]|uniref:Topoisomerase 1-associated factor 1 n=1 Tax=Babjeviella inositovora NRRL Y-12698 TaxID=984486 RepID=A0A1E3QRB4_9ASCO|nr:uncharacterized protein BABINDRAFT_175653 [Babjeviella inositovora NRRL Y-12698]ODQ80235.1 hypothetical protein BABINDRAFT_175653 [Babjeviella inositovora NRRL Y-12698]